jgi:hypothetical protein
VREHPHRHLSSSQRAACDAVRNKMLDSYRAVREAAKERQRASLPVKGQKGFQPSVPQLIEAHKNKPTETNQFRAKAVGTNREYIDIADKLLEQEPNSGAIIVVSKLRVMDLAGME